MSPGTVIGTTWYDAQHFGSMGRMITWSRFGNPDTLIVHFSWTGMPSPAMFGRHYRYDSWNAAEGSFGTEAALQSLDDFGGFVEIDATDDGRAVIGGQNWEIGDGMTDCHFYWDACPGCSDFSIQAQVPRALAEYEGEEAQQVIWPKFRYYEGAAETVLHVLALKASEYENEPLGLYYFRKVGGDASGSWDNPPRIVDTVYIEGYDLAVGNNGEVALVWVADLPCPGDPCDTCSGYECRDQPKADNDVYCQISYDGGMSWQPRLNITKNEDGSDGFRPFVDISALFSFSGNLHIVWCARRWSSEVSPDFLGGRIFHWSEDNPYLRTVHDFNWGQTTCNGGEWQLTAAKVSISECDGKFYVVFVQFNDLPHGIESDCASSSNPGYPNGAANGDLYVTISNDGGVTWDEARNLTNSRTPGCDSTGGVGGACESDGWPSVAEYGTDYAGDFSAAEIVVPSGSSDPGTYYLDVQYLTDHSAGAIAKNEGYWAQAEVKWFRLACVEPIAEPRLSISPQTIDYPSWSKHGLEYPVALFLENDGNAVLNYTVTVEEETGPPGWLDCTGLSGTLAAGLHNKDTGTIVLNAGGIINSPGSTIGLSGRIIFTSNASSSPDTLSIRHWITDTLFVPAWDTFSTLCQALTVSNTGNMGHQGIGSVNMDYVNAGDCDTNARVYLYDGSPIVSWVKGTDTMSSFSVYQTSFTDADGFIPLEGTPLEVDTGGCLTVESGTFITHDSLVALSMSWYAPVTSDSCHFLISRISFTLNRDTTITQLRFGALLDWDIPSDSGADNGSGYDTSRLVIYQYGGEYNQDDSTECQENDRRFGGVVFLDRLHNQSSLGGLWFGASTSDNATYVYPSGRLMPTETFMRLGEGGYSLYSSSHPDSQLVDLHTLVSFDTGMTLTPADTYTYVIALVTIQDGSQQDFLGEADKARQWYQSRFHAGCCVARGNADGIAPVNVADLTYMVNFLFKGGDLPPCEEEGDVDASGATNVADLTYLINFLFKGGEAPPPC